MPTRSFANRLSQFSLRSLLLALVVSTTALSLAADAGKPLEVLYITGGCCHDYEGQKMVFTGMSASRPSRCATQRLASGHAPQSGRSGVQTIAPRSIIA